MAKQSALPASAESRLTSPFMSAEKNAAGIWADCLQHQKDVVGRSAAVLVAFVFWCALSVALAGLFPVALNFVFSTLTEENAAD